MCWLSKSSSIWDRFVVSGNILRDNQWPWKQLGRVNITLSLLLDSTLHPCLSRDKQIEHPNWHACSYFTFNKVESPVKKIYLCCSTSSPLGSKLCKVLSFVFLNQGLDCSCVIISFMMGIWLKSMKVQLYQILCLQ